MLHLARKVTCYFWLFSSVLVSVLRTSINVLSKSKSKNYITWIANLTKLFLSVYCTYYRAMHGILLCRYLWGICFVCTLKKISLFIFYRRNMQEAQCSITVFFSNKSLQNLLSKYLQCVCKNVGHIFTQQCCL